MNSPITAETILVVDDYEAVCSIIEILLCRVGYHVLTTTTCAEALQLASETPKIDLLIANLGMPEMPGEELAARFSEMHPSAPVIFTSGLAESATTSRPLLAKPFTDEELRRAVHQTLQARPAISQTSEDA